MQNTVIACCPHAFRLSPRGRPWSCLTIRLRHHPYQLNSSGTVVPNRAATSRGRCRHHAVARGESARAGYFKVPIVPTANEGKHLEEIHSPFLEPQAGGVQHLLLPRPLAFAGQRVPPGVQPPDHVDDRLALQGIAFASADSPGAGVAIFRTQRQS